MDDQQMDRSSQDFSDSVNRIGKNMISKATNNPVARKAKKAVGSAVKKAIFVAIKEIAAFFIALLPYLLVGALLIGFIAAIWDVSFEERGSMESFDLYPDNQNILVTDKNNIIRAVALTKNQAYISAYYKYMACSSYQKTVDAGDLFSFDQNTSDFAGLQDYYEKEGYFYLSPNFIKMADERLNKGKFLYPEQIIKPVSYELSNGSVSLKPIYDDNGAIQVTSQKLVKASDGSYHVQGNEKTEGVWDYGFGSVLKYDALTKEKYIDCEYTSYPIDVDEYVTDSDGDGSWVHKSVETVTIPSGSTVDQVMAQYDAEIKRLSDYDDDENPLRAIGPNRDTLKAMVETEHHINMWLEGKDIKIGKRTFDSASLSDFSNNTEKYPLQIPLINSVATFSGDISYSYTPFTELSDIYDVGDFMDEDENPIAASDGSFVNFEDTAEPINQVKVGSTSCGTTFWVSRVGNVKTVTPVQSSEQDHPVGSNYLHAYCENYATYVPEAVLNDNSFLNRIDGDQEKLDLLKSLGVLVPYTGISTSGANYNVFAVTNLTASDFEVLLKGTAFAGMGADWVRLEQEYGVNAIFGMAVAYQESGFGTSTLAKNKNNAFGLLGRNGWMSFNSLGESIDSFGRTISKNSLYINKSIDEIATHYCTSDPTGWATAIKSLMSSRYTDLISNGINVSAVTIGSSQSVVGGNSSEVDADAVDLAIKKSGLSMEDLYANVNFDVLSATNMLQQITPDADDSGHFSWFGKLFDTVSDLIGNFFDSVHNVFPSYGENTGDCYLYGLQLADSDIEDIVLQTVTFSSGSLYTSAYNAYDPSNLKFLFVGKESMFGTGTASNNITLIPGVGTTIDGFISPTTDHYQAISGWSAATGGVELSVPSGTKILSVADGGTVSSVKQNHDGSGYSVEISYKVDGKRYSVQYKYLASVNVSTNSRVNSGDLIGLSGTRTDGTPCLFFGFTDSDGRNVDPLDYFYQPTYSNSAIIEVAKTQLGNKGGLTYKQWYPLNALDPWCACFVSWCADQCGFINSGVFPKFASCGTGIESYFKPNGIYWSVSANGVFTPTTGNLIFFDWDHDGKQDHVGLVEKCENGIVYTIEGNSSNMVREKTYSMYSPDIFGYAFPDYQTKIVPGT